MTTVINMRGEPVHAPTMLSMLSLGSFVNYRGNPARIVGSIYTSPPMYDLRTGSGKTVFSVKSSEIKPMEAQYV